MKGFFQLGTERIPNTVLDQGEEAFLKMVVSADNSFVASGGNFYVGLVDTISFTDATTLADIGSQEPSGNGYARIPIARNAIDWNDFAQVNGIWRALTKQISFIASGGDYSKNIVRAFLCNVSAGTSGRLFSISGALETPVLLHAGESFPVRYELWFN